MTPSEFLTELWGNPPPAMVYVWRLPSRRSIWYDEFSRVDRDMEACRRDEVYTGGSAAARKGTSKDRVEEIDAAAIPGVWADIDIYHQDAHKGKSLPATREQAREAMSGLPHAPTIVVDSGHGLQYWWLWEKPWLFRDAQEHEQARRIIQWWHRTTKDLFEARGWTTDSVFDLSRVMRLPGTFNNKVPGDPKPVAVALRDGPRYSVEDFARLVPEEFVSSIPPSAGGRRRPRRTAGGEKSGGGPARDVALSAGFVLNPDAQPNLTRLEGLIKADQKFQRTWERNRGDLKDQSASSYNMSIADTCIRAGWPEQEVVNAMIFWRSKHGEDLKLRENYYALTIAKAREPIRMERDQTRLDETLMDPPEDQGDVLKNTLASLFGVDIIRVIKYTGDPPVYYMETLQGNITIGQIDRIYSQAKFRELVGAATNIVIPQVSRRDWEKRVQAILLVCEEVDVGDASHPTQQAHTWVTDYLMDRGVREEDWEKAAQSHYPFIREERVRIFMEDFRRWLDVKRNTVLNPHEAGRRLRQMGAEPDKVNVIVGNRRTSRGCWELPQEFTNPDAEPGADPSLRNS